MKFPMDRPVKIVMLGAGGTGGYVAPYLFRLLHMLDIIGCLFFKSCFPAIQIQHTNLIAHYDAVRFCPAVQMNMKWASTIRVGDGANHRQAVDTIEEVIADDQCWTTPPLFMPCLRIKVHINNITLFKHSYHASLPSALPHSISSDEMRSICSIGFP